jgi:hypothetical protein
MTDFVLEQHEQCISSNGRTYNYANFLKQPLTLEMFVPCDNDGNVLKEVISFDPDISSQYYSYQIYQNQLFQEAKVKVLFKGFCINQINSNWFDITNIRKKCVVFTKFGHNNDFKLNENYSTIEDLIYYDLILAVSF